MSRIRADKFVNNAATGAPQLTYGAEVVAGVGLTGAGGINVGGAVTAASGNFTGNVSIGGTLTYEDVTNIDSIGILTARSGIQIPNDSGKLRAGTDLELQVFHDGTNSVIKDTRNSGKVRVQADNFDIIDKDASETMLSATVDGAVSLNYNGSTKLATNNTGVTVTGTLGATAVTGDGSALTGITTGIAMAQQWRLTSDSTGNVTPLTNWEAIDTYGQGSLGSAMTVSSGIFTYPSTGIYLVLFNLVGYSDNHTQNIIAGMQHTTDNSTYNTVAQGQQGIYDFNNSYPSWATTSTSYMFDITDTSNHKTRFTFGAGQGNESVKGHTSINYTTVTFIRLGDT